MYPVVYWCTIFNDFEMKTEYVSGCTFAHNYAEAMSNIEAYYGNDICDVKLEMVDESTVLEFKTYEEAKKIVSDV